MFYGGMLGELVYSFQGTTVIYLHIISEIIWIFYTLQCSNIKYFNGLCWLDQHLFGYAVFERSCKALCAYMWSVTPDLGLLVNPSGKQWY